MAKSGSGKAEEPSIGPLPERWYNLVLGPSFGDRDTSTKFCTLRYEFKPASIDKSQPGSLQRKKDKTVAVEFHNNQFGKPRVRFEGVSEDYKENDAVLFFDGETFRLERLHRAVKRLRHVRLPGEATAGPSIEHCSSPPRLAGGSSSGDVQNVAGGAGQSLEVEVEKIDINDPVSEALGVKSKDEDEPGEAPVDPTHMDSEELVSIVDSDGPEVKTSLNLSRREIHSSIDINIPQQNEEEVEIADVDVSDNEPVYPGRNAADALRAQVVVERDERSSSSSSSSESGNDTSSSAGSDSKSESGNGSSGRSSSSGSSTSSSNSETSEGDSVNSI
ncbi:hypothetical protein MLD38_034664 [Melastoma candidum]|uniref:Uncharacterized protein n=1 Tax=Melastoma candidum TaxID=119954 RepID=A0ACB9MAS6_9MYRT|nr:hypothetical protein MLD38_034664 [Melastoma candidum]